MAAKQVESQLESAGFTTQQHFSPAERCDWLEISTCVCLQLSDDDSYLVRSYSVHTPRLCIHKTKALSMRYDIHVSMHVSESVVLKS